MAPQWCSRSEFFGLVQTEAARPGRSIVVLDGYPAAGKTTLAMALARIPAVTWVPLDHYQQGLGFDFRRLHREVIRPFRKKGRVRDLTHVRGAVVQHQGERKARGRTTGISLVVLEGQNASSYLEETDADYLCWVDCERSARLRRVEARSQPALLELRESIEFAEQSGLRERAITIADFVVDSS